MVYADAGGHIGYQLVGQLPKRRRGHGTLPLPGWLEGVGWEDEHVPFDEMPSLHDPAIGFVASANNRPPPTAMARISAWTGWTATARRASSRSWPGATTGTSPHARPCSST